MTDINRDFKRLWTVAIISYTLLLIASLSVFLMLASLHHERLARSFALSARASLVIHDLRQGIMTLNPAVGDSFELIEFHSPEGQIVFSLPDPLAANKIKAGMTTVAVAVPIFEDSGAKIKVPLGRLVFYYDSSMALGWLILLWVAFLAMATPIYQRARLLIQRRHQEILLIRQSEVASQIAKQVAHDIRSPISALNMVVAASGGLAEDKKQLIKHAADRINSIANDLLEQSKVQSTNKISLSYLVNMVAAEKRVQFGEGSIKTEIPDKALIIVGDKNELARVLSNLINNSLEAEGNVTVSLRESDARAEIQISDKGKGIPADVLKKIGTRGFSFGKSGSGLGFAHAKEIIEKLGGTISIQSEMSKGTTVRIVLPSI